MKYTDFVECFKCKKLLGKFDWAFRWKVGNRKFYYYCDDCEY